MKFFFIKKNIEEHKCTQNNWTLAVLEDIEAYGIRTARFMIPYSNSVCMLNRKTARNYGTVSSYFHLIGCDPQCAPTDPVEGRGAVQRHAACSAR